MTLKKRLEEVASKRLEDAKGRDVFRSAPAGYTLKPEDNLIQGLTRDDFWCDLESGDGSELKDTKRGPAKFCAAYSSSALAVNSFGPFRRHPERLELLGFSFEEAQFERKCPTGLGGNAPNLDFLARGKEIVVGVESKFLEPLSGEVAGFVNSYRSLVERESDRPCDWLMTS
jgi:Restriction Endonuclease associating with ARP